MDEEQLQVVSEDRSHFTILPNLIFDLDLSANEFRLYATYRKICGEGGACWMSLATLAEACRITRHTIIAARESLEKIGLIRVEKIKTGNGSTRVVVHLTPIWEKNSTHCGGSAKEALGERLTSAKEALGGVQRKHSNKITMNKNNKRAGSPVGVGSQNGFDLGDRKGKEPRYVDQVAKRLYEALSEKRKITGTPNLWSWGEHLRTGLLLRGRTSEEVDAVLAWFIKNLDGKYVPRVFSMKDFVNKFDAILDCSEFEKKSTTRPSINAAAERVKEDIRRGRF